MTVLDADELLPDAEPASGDESAASRALLLAHAPEGLEAAWLAARIRRSGTDILPVARDGGRARFLAAMVAFMAPEIEIVEIPAWDCLPYDRISPSAGIMAERLRGLAKLAQLRYADIPESARGAFDRLALDFLSVVIAGLGDAECVRAADAFGGLSRFGANASATAFALGVCAHWFDWDDTDDESHVHGGAVIFPALLGVCAARPPATRNRRRRVPQLLSAEDGVLVGAQSSSWREPGQFLGLASTKDDLVSFHGRPEERGED